jgi:hypothetical protein
MRKNARVMTDARTAVIPVEDDPADARLIRDALQVSEARFRAMSDAAPLAACLA